MPGPGGGGGGGRGGSFGGGGHGGGGFGGGPRGGHHGGPRPMHGGWGFWGPRRHFWGGGGCLGGLLGMILVPIIILIVVIAMLFSFFGGLNKLDYNMDTLETYANDQYFDLFKSYTGIDQEDCLLIVVTVDTDYSTFRYVAWPGYHVVGDLYNQLGRNGYLNGWMEKYINSNSYRYSLAQDLVNVMNELTTYAENLELESFYTCNHDYSDNLTAYVENRTNMLTYTDDLEAAVKAFAEATGIPTILLIEDASEIFSPQTSPIAAIAVVGLIVLVAVLIIAGRKKKNPDNENDRRYDD